ncbi:class I SAM-dependent methyltransferase [Vibrio vulnificus]|uniref:class I SAM-dependent DNA methyltransferase n=1 Tax=Vibrio vulnificus TaxID=672 RepID=UPI001A1B4D80|nr:class I SAM-dependent methyltransferase [Vibrio vulnificus]EGQ7932692.1 class I SAM-dependent methyltransferase [Vibrio vulnificus]EGQ9275529.1 class I SAM-dependent methyltransferase [Vibrio vulnificus]EGQ9972428.1 class I SAM-dependent methyltransferase [Vibrio vulnificus]EJB5282029.1 class I SAM-dependent methyltransferase [Vibrio vulnificus]EJE8667489.1 class I SAM-dependent methyltransferase [Vibrio vulnificus]
MEAVMAHNWDEAAKEWESNPATEQFSQSVFNQLKDLVSLNGARVLDLGCGTGLLSQKISPLAKDIVALDSSEEMIEELDKKQLPNVEPVVDGLTRGLVAQHPAFRGQFDVVVASSVCAFIDDLETALEVSHSLLNIGGTFIHWDWVAQSGEEGLTMQRAEMLLKQAGFADVSVTPAFEMQFEGETHSVFVGQGKRLS